MDNILKSWRPWITLAIIGFFLYLPTLWFNFTYLDDNILILRNINFLTHLGNLTLVFKQAVFSILHSTDFYYRPLLTLSFMLDAHFVQAAPWLYHLSNILFHLIAAWLILAVLLNMNYSRLTSFIASLIFLVHPILTQAVAWLPGRNDSLVTIFVLIAFLLLIKTYSPAGRPGPKALAITLSLFFFGLAILTKEIALVFPLLGLLYLLFWKIKNLFSLRTLAFIIGWTLLFFGYFWLRQKALVNPADYTFWEAAKSMLVNSPAVLIYIGKIILPFNLSVFPVLTDTNFGWAVVAILPLALLFASTRSVRFSHIIFGLGWFLIFLLPAFIRPDAGAGAMPDFLEHRAYLPFLGFLLIILEADFFQKIDLYQPKALAITLAIILFLAGMTLLYSQNFKNRLVFWESAAAASPSSPFVHRNLGAMYYLDQNFLKAGAQFQKAIALRYYEPMAHNNLGLVYMNLGMLEQAEQELKSELDFNPKYDDAHYNLGLIYSRQKKDAEAVKEWEKTLELNPDYLDGYAQLISYYQTQKNQTKIDLYLKEFQARGGRVQ